MMYNENGCGMGCIRGLVQTVIAIGMLFFLALALLNSCTG